MANTVLIVEDDPDTVNLVGLYLKRDGHKVLSARDGLSGLRLAREAKPDVIVLDIMLPRLDGIEICRTLREESSTPIIMLTARVEEDDRLAGLDLGADDYVTKPFSPRELAARVRAVLRRAGRDAAESAGGMIEYGDVAVDPRRHSACVGETSVSLTPTEFRLLTTMIREPGRTFTRAQLIDQVFGFDFDGFDRTVDVHVSSLRRKIERGGSKRRYVHTVYGVGYRFGNE